MKRSLRRWLSADRQAPTGTSSLRAGSLDLLAVALARPGLDRLSFVNRQPAARGLGGEHRGRRRAPSTDFVDYRAYAAGDDLRRVDWNVYGRLGSLQVKLTEAQERLDLVLVLDCSASMSWGEPDKFACARLVVAALAYVGLARFDAVRVVCPGLKSGPISVGPVRGRSRFAELARFLAVAAADGRSRLPDLLGAGLGTCLGTRQSGEPRPSLVVVSDLLDPDGCGAALDTLRRRADDVVVIHVVAPQELDPELQGRLELVDAETGEAVEVGLSAPGLDGYRERYTAWLAAQAAACAARGLRYARVRSDTAIEAVLLGDLRRAGVLR